MDVKFVKDNMRFNFRVAGIFLNGDKVFLCKTKGKDYYSLIGGRVQFLEDTKNALIRETKEEIGVKIKEDELTLIKVVENFFNYQGELIHEILFVYLVDNKEIKSLDNVPTKDKDNAINKWYPLDEVLSSNVKPDVAKKWFKNPEFSVEILNDLKS